jgi:hypothetical protein
MLATLPSLPALGGEGTTLHGYIIGYIICRFIFILLPIIISKRQYNSRSILIHYFTFTVQKCAVIENSIDWTHHCSPLSLSLLYVILTSTLSMEQIAHNPQSAKVTDILQTKAHLVSLYHQMKKAELPIYHIELLSISDHCCSTTELSVKYHYSDHWSQSHSG